MSSSSYVYNVSVFSNGLDTYQLHQSIKNSNISVPITGIDTNGANVIINFDNILLQQDIDLLNILVSNHVPIVNYVSFTDSITPKHNLINNFFYTLVATYIYNSKKTLSYIKIVSYMDNDITSYNIKIVDNTTRNIISQQTFTNTTENINDMGTIMFVPNEETNISILVLKIGGEASSEVHINNISFQFN